MMNDLSYKSIAKVWDWDGYDNTPEFEKWKDWAGKYGKHILAPMCALAQAAAYLARHGFLVTAFDIADEMISEAEKRLGPIENLKLHAADICSFAFEDAPFDFAFIETQDLHLLSSIEEVKKALAAINSQLRKGGGLVLELTLPAGESHPHEKRVFHPRVPNYTDKTIWKEHEGYYDANTKINHIHQTYYIQTDSGIETIPYVIDLQYYDRDIVLSALDACGFDVIGEYKNRDREPWTEGEASWTLEAIKK